MCKAGSLISPSENEWMIVQSSNIMQFRTGTKRTETARTDCEDARWSLELGNNSPGTLNSNLLTNWQWIHATVSQRVNFWQCCIANAKWMAFANWKVAMFYVVNGAALELQFARKSYVSVIMLRFWGGGVFTCQYRRFAFVFRIVALEYWCLGVSLSSRVFGKLIRAVGVRRQLAEKKCPVIRYTIILISASIALLDREFNRSRKCLEVPIRKKFDSRNTCIWRIQ